MATCDICVNMSDIMTPQSFSSLVTTLIKYVVYEKQLIPYPYDRLKLYIKKYKELNLKVSVISIIAFTTVFLLLTLFANYTFMLLRSSKGIH